jgi:hypothetical protein
MLDIDFDVFHQYCHLSTTRRHQSIISIGNIDLDSIAKDID